MLTILLLIIFMFLIICIVPLLQWLLSRKETEEITEYEFPSSLLDADLTDLKWESVTQGTMNTLSLRDRGSVRITQGYILTKKAMEEKKATIFSIELP